MESHRTNQIICRKVLYVSVAKELEKVSKNELDQFAKYMGGCSP